MVLRRFALAAIPFAIAMLVLQPANSADGPKDNQFENVRPVPPKGVAVPAADREELKAGQAALQAGIERLKLRKDVLVSEHIPDVEIYSKAVKYALEYDEFFNVKEIAVAKLLLKQGNERLAELQKGEASWATKTGLVVRGYRSKIDGSVQPYGLVVPKEYDFAAKAPHRLDFWWHGRGENLSEVNFIDGRQKSPGEFTPAGAFVLHPYGRYCNANKFAGEIDTLECLEHVKKHYRIDDSRVVARGFSMGGAACWQYAVHYPTLFCAAAPGAGFSETPEFLKVFQNEKVEPTWYEKKLWGMYNCTDVAQNIFNIPTVAYSGENDNQKQAADVMAREMKKLGMELKHIIGPKTGHSYEKNAKIELNKQLDAIVAKGLPIGPDRKEIKFTTYTLRYNECAWLTVTALERHWEKATVRGTYEDGVYKLDVSGVYALKIASRDKSGEIIVNGERAIAWKNEIPTATPKYAEPISYTCTKLGLAGRFVGVVEGNPRKSHGLQGPIDDAFMDSFLMVSPTGTPMNEKIGTWTTTEMKHATEHWRKQFRGDAPIKADKDVTELDIKNNNLILWGDPKSNAILAKIADKLPLAEFTDNTVTVSIYPNPLNPKKYVVLNSGFTFREYDYLNNARQVSKLPDYAIIDVNTPANSRYPGKVVRAGFFDESWKLQPNDGK